MSFNLEFVAEREDALQIIGEENAPAAVKDFLTVGLAAFLPGSIVRVKAVGHLYLSSNDYNKSNGELLVEQVNVRKPKTPSPFSGGGPADR